MENEFIKKLETRLQRIYRDPDKVKETIQLIGTYMDAYEQTKKQQMHYQKKTVF